MFFESLFKSKPAVTKAYWWREVPNFGDAIAPFLLERFAEIDVEWDTISRSSVATVGSILEHIPPLWDGVVLGSGRLFENSRIHLKSANVLALRGPLSARGVVGHGEIALGDPGLLAADLVGPQEKKWHLGIVPHWQDDELVERFKPLIPKQFTVKVIEPSGDPLDVIREIGACRRIVTSSLHGMILADAFGGIPRRVEICEKMAKDGGIFKFRDYSLSIKAPFEPGKLFEPKRVHVEDTQNAILDAYHSLKSELGNL